MKEKLNIDCLRDVSIRQLRVLAAIEQSGSVRAASTALRVTPPAISQQLKLLEDAAGLPLVERSTRGLTLTQAGHYLLATHTRIETALRDGSAACQELKGLSRGHVTIGATSTAKYIAPRVIASFAKSHPQIETELKIGNREEIVSSLETLDIAIMGSPPATVDVERRLIGPHPHLIIAAPDHRLARLKRVPVSEIAEENFLLREPGSGTRMLMERTFAKLDIIPRKVTEFGSNETIKQAVMAGLGIAFLSAHTAASEISAGWLKVLPVAGLPVMREWFAVRVKQRRLLPASEAMWEFVGEKGANFLPSFAPEPRRSKKSNAKQVQAKQK